VIHLLKRSHLGLIVVVSALALSPTAAQAAAGPTLAGSVSDSTFLSGSVSVAVSGAFAYSPSYYAGQLTALSISNPSHPAIAGWSNLPANSAGQTDLTAGSTINIAGGFAFVVSKNRNASPPSGGSPGSNDDGTGNSLTILDVHTDPAHPALVGTIRDPQRLFGSYGVAVSGGFAYVAYQGVLPGQPQVPDTSTGGFSVINLSSPSGPAIVANIDNGSLPAPWTGTNALAHATSVAISGHFAFVTAFNSARLTVIDISNPLNPVIAASLHDAGHMAFPNDVALQGNFAYVADQTLGSSDQFAVVDISNPTAPKLVGAISSPGVLGGAYRVRVRGSFAYISASSSDSVAAIDITNPAAPRVAGSLTDSGHLHRTTGLDVDSSGRYLIVASPYQSTQTQAGFPPYPLQPGGRTATGTISVVDLAPAPIAASILPGSEPPKQTTGRSANFTFTVSDAVSTVQCQLDRNPFGPCTSLNSARYSSLSTGKHKFVVRATDVVGHTATDTYTWSVGAAVHAVLSGVGRRHAKLKVAVLAPQGALVKQIRVVPPRGLSFAKAKAVLAKGVTLVGPTSQRVRFKAVLRRGALLLTLPKARGNVELIATSPAVAVSKSLASSVKHRHRRRLTVKVTVLDSRHGKTVAPIAIRLP
jgi:hypothetical protein